MKKYAIIRFTRNGEFYYAIQVQIKNGFRVTNVVLRPHDGRRYNSFIRNDLVWLIQQFNYEGVFIDHVVEGGLCNLKCNLTVILEFDNLQELKFENLYKTHPELFL